jgi:DNA-binding LytR/AlgR family response regulator
MPEMSGTELADKLRESQYKGEIVFLSSSNEYATESYKVDALTYLLKPVDAQIIAALLKKLEQAKKQSDTEGLAVITRRISRFLHYHEISHIEVVQHKVFFRLNDGTELETNKSLNVLLPQILRDGRFAQCHRSYVVNLNDVAYIQNRDIVMRTGHTLPISKSFPDFKRQYNHWILNDTDG